MSNFTIIRQKLVVIFIIIVFIISSLVFLNSVYNALFVWYDNDNGENVNDKNVPVSTMFGYKILLNSYVIKGDCTNYNKDIVLTTNINTILFKIYNLIFTFFLIIILISLIVELFGRGKMSATIQDSFYVENKSIIYTGIASALILFIISNNFNNPGKKYYNKYEDDQSTFENYLYGEYNKIIDNNYKNYLIRIIKNTNKNNFYKMNIKDYFDSENDQYQFDSTQTVTEQNLNDIDICYNILDLCKKLCIINKDTSVDVVKVFSKFIDNCEKSNLNVGDSLKNMYLEKIEELDSSVSNSENTVTINVNNEKLNAIIGGTSFLSKKELLDIDAKIDFSTKSEYYIIYTGYNDDANDIYFFKVTNKQKDEESFTEKYFKKYILDNLLAYFTDLKCIFGELDFLKNNFNSILSLLWWGDGVSKNIDNKNNEEELEPIFFSSLLTKEYLKKCKEDEFKKFNESEIKYFKKLGKYTIKQGEDKSDKSFIQMMNEAKKSMYTDLFLIKGIITGVIIFTLANIVLKKYYNEYSPKTLLEIDKKIILSKIDDNIYDAIKYENFIKPLLKEGNYNVNIILSIIIILLLLKIIPGYTYPVMNISLDKIDCN
jgi:hypothetical protein